MTKPRDIVPSTPLSRRLVKSVVGFGVGIGVGLAPFLGRVSVPGFSALLSLFPLTLQSPLLPLSAFLMGIIAAGTQFYSGTNLSLRAIERVARRLLIVMLVSFLLLLIVYSFLVTRVHFREDFVISYVTGLERQPGCPCDPKTTDPNCIKELTANPDNVEACWGKNQIKLNGLVLSVLYLFLTGSFVGFVGLILLQEQAKAKVKKSAAPGKK